MEYTIKHVCNELQLTVHTVRHYCDMGLVPNLKCDAHGNRIFNEESINWLRAAAFLRASGLSISEIKHYFDLCQKGASTIKDRQKILLDLRIQAEKDLEAAQRRIDCLTDKINLCQDVMDGKCDDECNPLNW